YAIGAARVFDVGARKFPACNLPNRLSVDQPVNTPAYCLTGQIAVVTGASGGIGRAIALDLAKAGSDVVVHGHRRRGAAQSLAVEIQQLGRAAHVLLADLAKTDQCNQFASAAWNWRGYADIWINTA